MASRTASRIMLEARRSAGATILLIGIIVFGIAGASIMASKLTFERPWEKYDSVHVSVTDAKGIFAGGDSVRIHGVIVGVVSKSKLVNEHPVLTLDILKKYTPIYKNAQFRIRPVTPLDDLYVDITNRGTPSAGEITSGYTVPASQTTAPVDVSRILDTFNGDTRSRLTTLLTELDKGLPDGGVQLRSAFAQLAPFLHVADQATSVLRTHQQDVKEVVHNFGTLSEALADRNDALNQFVRQGASTTSELAAHSGSLQGTLQQLAALLPEMRSSFTSVDNLTTTLNPALTDLKPVTAHLQSGLNALGNLGLSVFPAVKKLRPALRDLKTMAVQLAPTSVSLQKAFVKLTPQAPQFSTLASQVTPCLNSLTAFFNNTISVLKYYDANGAFPRADETVDLDVGGGIATTADLNTRTIPTCSGAGS